MPNRRQPLPQPPASQPPLASNVLSQQGERQDPVLKLTALRFLFTLGA